jgi:hypothetical protein
VRAVTGSTITSTDCKCKGFLDLRWELRMWFVDFPVWLFRDARKILFTRETLKAVGKRVFWGMLAYTLLVALPATGFGYLLRWVGVPVLASSLGQFGMTVFLFWKMDRILQFVAYLVRYQKEYAEEVDQPKLS